MTTETKTAARYTVREYYNLDDYAVTAYHETLDEAYEYAELLDATRSTRNRVWVRFTDGTEQQL